MFSTFNYIQDKDDEVFLSDLSYSAGKKMYDKYTDLSHELLDKHIHDGMIDGIALREDWFKVFNTDVFISHSHKDLRQVISLAGWLNRKFNLSVFVDSCVWGYCDDLLKQIDNAYCKHRATGLYNYMSRNCSTSHVHALLSTALIDMMDRSECIIFYNTPNSIPLKNEIANAKADGEVTFSPWIFQELSMTEKLRIRFPDRKTLIKESISTRFVFANTITIGYNVTKFINDMEELDCDLLLRWKNDYRLQTDTHPLDVLYRMFQYNGG